jgi:hypothetical protein
MTAHDDRKPSTRVWTAAEIEQQLDEVTVVLSRGVRSSSWPCPGTR